MSTKVNLFLNLDNPFFSIRSTPSGHILLQEPISNDLILLDSKANEVTRHKGRQKLTFRKII